MAAGVNLLRASSSGVGSAAGTAGRFMEIMKPLASFLAVFLPLLFAANPDLLPGDSDKVTGTAIIREINIARQNPTLYANFLEQIRQNYAGRVRLMPGRLPVCTHEGVHAVDEAIRFLRHARPFPALALSPGLCSAAADR